MFYALIIWVNGKTMKGCKVHREKGNNMVIFNGMTKVLAILSAVDIIYSEG